MAAQLKAVSEGEEKALHQLKDLVVPKAVVYYRNRPLCRWRGVTLQSLRVVSKLVLELPQV